MGDAYRLERELGRGGMSRLFLATEASLSRQVVVKVLPPDFTSLVSTERFKQEIEVAAHLQHPNILPVLTAGTRGDLLYYIIPYVPGESLRHRLTREGRLPIPDAIGILREIADALAYAHAQGVIHRDIKPENILLEGSHAVLTDFGVARALGESRSGGRLTDSGLAVGTAGYMAPEQAAGDRQVDGRADVYALAVVGYEMLAGVPPFEGSSAQAVLAAHLTATPRPLLDARPETPPQAAIIIARALAKDPNARLRTAAELRDALGPAHAGTDGRGTSRRLMQGAGAALLLLLAGAGALVFRRSAPATLDPTLLAVAPFDVLAPGLSLWREGLVDLLSRNLDGAGPIRTVSPTVVIRRWEGRADPASAAALSRQTGAALTVFGSLVAVGPDSVRIDAAIHDAERGRSIGEVRLFSNTRHMDRLADSLALGILRELGRTRDIAAVRTAGLRATSFPALKAFLEGEQLYRRGIWDSAQSAYQRALAHDSVFVPALRRLGLSLSWRAVGDQQFVPYLLRAGELNHGLSRRDSLLVAADSLFAAQQSPDLPQALHRTLLRRLLGMLDESTGRYPEDPEVWYALGEVRYHLGWMAGVGPAEMLEAFDRAIALDSSFTPAYVHAAELGLHLHGLEGYDRYAGTYLSLRPSDDYATGTKLLNSVFASYRERPGSTDSILRAATLDQLLQAVFTTMHFPDSQETAVRLARALAAGRGHSTGFVNDPLVRRQSLAAALAYRGHLREALQLLGGNPPITWVSSLSAEIALAGGGAPENTNATFRRWLRHGPLWSPEPPPRGGPPGPLMFALPWWAARRDSLSLAAFARRADSAQRTTPNPAWKEMTQYSARAARAYSELARGDTSAALTQFEAVPEDVWWGALERLTKGQILARRGREAEALALFEHAFPYHWGGPAKVLTTLEAARAAERLGDGERAAAGYQFVLDMWRKADPELEPYLTEARQGLARLTSEPRR